MVPHLKSESTPAAYWFILEEVSLEFLNRGMVENASDHPCHDAQLPEGIGRLFILKIGVDIDDGGVGCSFELMKPHTAVMVLWENDGVQVPYFQHEE